MFCCHSVDKKLPHCTSRIGTYLEIGHNTVVSVLLLSRAKAIEGNGTGSLELRGGDQGDAHSERKGTHSEHNSKLVCIMFVSVC